MIRATLILTVVYLGLLILTFGRVEAQPIERDKITHGAVAFSGQVLCSAGMSEIVNNRAANVACFVAVNVAGIMLEQGAFGDNTKDVNDVIANIAGSGIGFGVVEWKF